MTYQWESADDAGFSVNQVNFETGPPGHQPNSNQVVPLYRLLFNRPFIRHKHGSAGSMNNYLACYCSPTITTIEPISLVQFSNINNPSACPVGSGGAVEDFTSITGNITAGVTVSDHCFWQFGWRFRELLYGLLRFRSERNV